MTAPAHHLVINDSEAMQFGKCNRRWTTGCSPDRSQRFHCIPFERRRPHVAGVIPMSLARRQAANVVDLRSKNAEDSDGVNRGLTCRGVGLLQRSI